MKKIFCLLLMALFANQIAAQNVAIKMGQMAPEISLPGQDGKKILLSDLKGKLVLVDFWATWCAPCMQEQPELKAIYEKHNLMVKSGRFEILGVSLDKSEEKWKNGIQRLKINWLQGSDLMFWRSPAAKDYGVEELPFNVIVDENGKIAAINIHGKDLEQYIDNYFSGK